MAQERFWEWRDDDATNRLDRWLLGILQAGVYRGYDFVPTGDMTLTLNHDTTGVGERDKDGAVVNKSVLLTSQGVVIKEDTNITLAIDVVGSLPRIDLIVLDHDYNENVVGGEAAFYSVIKGTPAANPVEPTLTVPDRQVIIGALYLPANTTQLNSAGVIFTRRPVPALGNDLLSFTSEYGGIRLTPTAYDSGSNGVIVDINTENVVSGTWLDKKRTGFFYGNLTGAPITGGGSCRIVGGQTLYGGIDRWAVSYLFHSLSDGSIWSRRAVFEYTSSTDIIGGTAVYDSGWARVDLLPEIEKKVPYEYLSINTELDTLTDNGHYWVKITESLIDSPAKDFGYTSGTNDFYTIIVLGDIGDNLVQLAIEANTQRMFVRNYSGGSFDNWREVGSKVESSNGSLLVTTNRPSYVSGDIFDVAITTKDLGTASISDLPAGLYKGLDGSDVYHLINSRVDDNVYQFRFLNGSGLSYRYSINGGSTYTAWVSVAGYDDIVGGASTAYNTLGKVETIVTDIDSYIGYTLPKNFSPTSETRMWALPITANYATTLPLLLDTIFAASASYLVPGDQFENPVLRYSKVGRMAHLHLTPAGEGIKFTGAADTCAFVFNLPSAAYDAMRMEGLDLSDIKAVGVAHIAGKSVTGIPNMNFKQLTKYWKVFIGLVENDLYGSSAPQVVGVIAPDLTITNPPNASESITGLDDTFEIFMDISYPTNAGRSLYKWA